MKLFNNLPGGLRAAFGALRFATVILGAFWLFMATFNGWVAKRFSDNPKLMVAVGEISLPAGVRAVELASQSTKPGDLKVGGLRGGLEVDLLSDDAALVSAVRWTMIPAMATFIAFSWLLFGSLRTVCANIERGEVFNEINLRLVRNIGLLFIGYSLLGLVLQLWAQYSMGGYLNQHVTLAGLGTGAAGALRFSLSNSQFPNWGGLLTGCLVLVVAEAFRQGLNLKTENDLTV